MRESSIPELSEVGTTTTYSNRLGSLAFGIGVTFICSISNIKLDRTPVIRAMRDVGFPGIEGSPVFEPGRA